MKAIEKKAIGKRPLLERFDWALWAMMAAYTLYGVVGWAGQRVLTARRTGGLLTPAQYLSAQSAFNLALGIAVSLALLGCFALCAIGSRGIARTAFLLGLPSGLGPIFALNASRILFSVLGLPTMDAGSVLAAAASAVVLMVPMIVTFLILAFSRRVGALSRWLLALAALLALLAAVFPVAVVVVSLLLMAGNPAVAPYMTAAGFVIYLRPVVLALGLAAAYFPNRRARRIAPVPAPGA